MRCRKPGPAPSHNEAGFTMIEALVAMTVLTLLAAVLLRGAVTLRQDAADVSDKASQAIVARGVLDEALRNRKLQDGRYSGTRDGWSWTLTAARVDLGDQIGKPQDTAAGKGPAWTPQRLTVAVGPVTAPMLETLRLAAP